MSNPQNICMGCMSYTAGKKPCPVCGFDIEKHFESPLVLPPGTTVYGDRYILGKVVGKPGIFGITYISWDTYTETKVAIKEYFPSICVSRYAGQLYPVPHSPDDLIHFRFGMEQFIKEAKKLVNFNHPNIVRVRDYFEENKTAYMVMNYYEGEPFLKYLASHGGKLNWKSACTIMLQLLDGLKVVHDKNYLHHDIKPHNIIYLREEKRPVLISFSTARFEFYQSIFGTSETMLSKYSPIENYVSNIKQGPWTDIYSCGATLYRIISGEDPPTAPERMLVDQMIYSSRLIADIPDDIARAVLKAMALDISERPHNIKQFKELIQTRFSEFNDDKKDAKDYVKKHKNFYEGDLELYEEENLIETVSIKSKKEVINKIISAGVIALLFVALISYFSLNKEIVFFDKSDGLQKSSFDSPGFAKGTMPQAFEGELGMRFVFIPPGDFMMGSPSSENDRDEDEDLHIVKIPKGFYMQTTEVTQSQWSELMGSNPSSFKSCGPDCPVESLSWETLQMFIKRLNETSNDMVYRLPTEAEWEYSCRAGTTTSVYKGNIKINSDKNATFLDEISWYGGNSCVGYGSSFDCTIWENREKNCNNCGTHPVGMKEPNAWGLYDMIGNVSEWCSDWYDIYQLKDSYEPVGPISGTQKVFRGGAWYFDARFCRAAARSKAPHTSRFFFLGFRLAAERKEDDKQQ